jgi:hypothetical protein
MEPRTGEMTNDFRPESEAKRGSTGRHSTLVDFETDSSPLATPPDRRRHCSGTLCVGNTTPHRRPPTPSAADVPEQNETHQGPTERSTCLVWSRPRLAPLPLLSLSLFDPHEQTRRSPAVLLRISPRPVGSRP